MTSHQLEPERQIKTSRIGLLDTLRGFALLAMAHYHFTWDLEMFGYLEPGTATSGWLKIYARAIAASFLFLAGFSLYLAHNRGIQWNGFGKRLGLIAAAAFAISVATVIAVPASPIFFGILHSIAACSLIGLMFLRVPALVTLIAAMAAFAAPHFLTSELFAHPIFYWLGLAPIAPRSNDYVPLLPWIGAFLMGMAACQFTLPRGWLEKIRGTSHPRNILALAGRHSLAFYLIHQPVLIALVYLFTLISPPPVPDPVEAYKVDCETSCKQSGNEEGLCGRFCGCTLELLQSRNLFDPMMSQSLNLQQQQAIGDVAQECRMFAN